jgi:hypothetical protein
MPDQNEILKLKNSYSEKSENVTDTNTIHNEFFPPLALQSFIGPWPPYIQEVLLSLFRHMVGLLRRVISPSKGLYPHRTTQHRKTRTNIHALSGTRTHDPSNQPAKTHASDRTATVTGTKFNYKF